MNAHVIKQGETASAIAKREGVSLTQIRNLNPGINLDKLSIGQQLILHATDAGEHAPTATGGYKVKRGETASAIAKREGVSLTQIRNLNPGINLDKLSIGQQLILHRQENEKHEIRADKVSTPTSQIPTPNKTATSKPDLQKQEISGDIMTQEKYNNELGEDVKKLKDIAKAKEGKKASTYIAPEGKSTIGYGHQLINKPKFLTDIEKLKLKAGEKAAKLKEALKNPANQAALKTSIQADLEAAIKNTGIKNVPSTVSADLKLTDAQIDLLLNSDTKNVKAAVEKEFGKEIFEKRTANQRAVVLDVYYNTKGTLKSAAPKFFQAFVDGDTDKAQAELDMFKVTDSATGKKAVQLGLIRRCYDRMMLYNDNKGISKDAEAKLLKAYNEYCANNNKKVASTFSEIQTTLVA